MGVSFRFILTLFLAAALPLLTQCARVGGNDLSARPSDKPIVPEFAAKGGGITAWLESSFDSSYRLSAIPGSFVKNGVPAAIRVAVYTVSAQWVNAAGWSTELMMIEGTFIGEVVSQPDGSLRNTQLIIPAPLDYLLLVPFDDAGGQKPIPVEVQLPNGAILKAPISAEGIGVFDNLSKSSSRNIWTSPNAIRKLNKNSPGFPVVRSAANRTFTASDLPNPFARNDIDAMAAAIVHSAVPSNMALKNKVLGVLNDLMLKDKPEGPVDYWVVNIIGYVIAADLIGYRTAPFSAYLHNLTDVWRAPTLSWGEQTMRSLWRKAPNHRIGLQTAVALAVVDTYLGKKEQYAQLVQEWTDMVENRSSMSGVNWKKNKWQADHQKPFFINPSGSVYMCGDQAIDISHVLPNVMATDNPCDPAFNPNQEHMQAIQAMVSFARIAERQGHSLWFKGDKAILRIAKTMRERYKVSIESYPGMVWLYRVMDKRYGTTWSCETTNLPDGQRWGAGQSLGWTWVESDWDQTCPTL